MIPAIALIAGIVQLVPSLTRIFGAGPIGQEAAEVAAKVAREVTGTSTNDAALDALRADPTKLLEYQNALLAQEKEFEALFIQDKASARDRDIQFLKAGTRNYRADFLVGISVIIVFTILGIVITQDSISEFAKGSLTTILGVFLNQLTNVFSFEFGTTRATRDVQNQITTEYIKSP